MYRLHISMWNIKVLTRTPETRGKSEHNGTEHLTRTFFGSTPLNSFQNDDAL